MMVIGYDVCLPVLEFDNRKIGNGKKGPVADYIQKFLKQDMSNNGIVLNNNPYLPKSKL